ncbi:signal peptidase II [Anaerocolumna xylanovorans]|uniref:Lipoprotein signal peptidase n=1 Tax=Anaerocolumna xylanovorans DSM 12503 TaxID=1121345 RepID=A0A1M7Y278_9FIRM|nr:signal peptidase II [Anaerocolumna xylanovorans]SHO45858.1 signal peptidase II [Anaerocolumna xylanovorans DSM 12503]
MRKFRHFIYFILLVILDQFTKHLAASDLKENPFIVIPKVFQFTYHENNGAVWGILSGQIVFLIILTFLLLSLMVFLYLKVPTDKRYNAIRIILVFICAGAVGNLIDRIFNRYVVDFIYFELIDFPVFNLADCYVTLSSILLILLGLFYYKDEDFEFLSLKSAKTVTTVTNDETEEKEDKEK